MHQPPRHLQKLLRRFCHVTLLEEIEGDLEEQYQERLSASGRISAGLYYSKDVLYAILSNRGQPTSQPSHPVSRVDAFNHFLKITLRNLRHNASSSIINISGLALSLASFLLIYLYVFDEMTYDTFHPNAENIYRISYSYERYADKVIETDARAGGMWVVSLKETMPEVKNFTRFSRFGYPGSVRYEKLDKLFVEQQFFWTDSTYTDIFSLPLVKGRDASAILRDPRYVIMNETTAKKYFGDGDPIGETIIYSRDGVDISLIVGAIMKNYPSNVHFHPDFIASNLALNPLWKKSGEDRVNHWQDAFTYSFFELENDVSVSKAVNLLTGFFRKHFKENSSVTPVLTRLTDIHFTNYMMIELETPGDIVYLYIFGSIGIVILFIATINYMNLATARSIKRSKEVGLRKMLGVRRSSLILQFLGESLLFVVIAFVISLCALILILPLFNELTGKQLTIEALYQGQVWAFLSATITLLALVAGSYPAFYLSRFKPSEALKGKVSLLGGAENFRKSLVVFQFTITIILIVSVAVIRSQMKLIQSTKLAEKEDQIVTIRLEGLVDKSKVDLFRQLALQDRTVTKISISDHLPRHENSAWSQYPVVFPALSKEERIYDVLHFDSEFQSMFDVKIIAGRGFQANNPADSASILVNEAAVKDLGLEPDQALGLQLESKPWANINGTVIGVVQDFNYRSIRRKISPTVFSGAYMQGETVNVKIERGQYGHAILQLEKAWKKVYPSGPFQYWFMDQEFENIYRSEIRMQKLSDYFAVFTAIIACLGLFGLAMFTAEQKTKEIGIRKVLGASVSQILRLLTTRFMNLIAIAYLIAVPIAIVVMNLWLENFTYKIALDWQTFILAGVCILILTYLTVSAVSVRAATRNPVDVMRHE